MNFVAFGCLYVLIHKIFNFSGWSLTGFVEHKKDEVSVHFCVFEKIVLSVFIFTLLKKKEILQNFATTIRAKVTYLEAGFRLAAILN